VAFCLAIPEMNALYFFNCGFEVISTVQVDFIWNFPSVSPFAAQRQSTIKREKNQILFGFPEREYLRWGSAQHKKKRDTLMVPLYTVLLSSFIICSTHGC